MKTRVCLSVLTVLMTLALVVPGSGCGKVSQPVASKRSTAEILAVLPLTGPGASLGAYTRDGVAQYLADHPDSALHVTIQDSTSVPQAAAGVFQQAIARSKPRCVITALSSVSEAIIPLAEQAGVFQIGVLTSSERILEGRKNIQRINDRSGDMMGPLAQYILPRGKKAAIIYANNELGLSCNAAFKTIFTNGGGTVLSETGFALDNRDVRELVRKTLEAKPDAIVVAGFGPAYIAIFRTLKEASYAGLILADANFSNPEALADLGTAAEGVIFVTLDLCLDTPTGAETQLFKKAYKAKFGNEPWLGAAYIYDALTILDNQVKGNKTPSQQSFAELGSWKGVTGTIDFVGNGECKLKYVLLKRQDSASVHVTD